MNWLGGWLVETVGLSEGTVHYIESIFFGFLAVLVAAVASGIVYSIWLNRNSPPGYAVGLDPSGLAKSPIFWILVFLVFAAGFYWQFRRI